MAAGLTLARRYRVRAPQRSRFQWFLTPVLPAVLLAVPTVVAGGINQAWVLLVEILR